MAKKKPQHNLKASGTNVNKMSFCCRCCCVRRSKDKTRASLLVLGNTLSLLPTTELIWASHPHPALMPSSCSALQVFSTLSPLFMSFIHQKKVPFCPKRRLFAAWKCKGHYKRNQVVKNNNLGFIIKLKQVILKNSILLLKCAAAWDTQNKINVFFVC